MNFYSFKRWHWACIGLALGLAFSLWRGWVGPEGTLIDRPTLESSEFEKLLMKKSPSGRPAVKDIRVFQLNEGTGWLTAEQLTYRGHNADAPEEYVSVKIPVKTPFIPTINPPTKVDPKFTVVDYLQLMKSKNPDVQFSTRWWAREPARSPIFALVGMVVLGGLLPSLMHMLVGVGHSTGTEASDDKEKKESYDLSRFGKGKSEPDKPVQRGPTEADLARLRELEAELERGLAAKDRASGSPAAVAGESATPGAGAEQAIRKLDAGPLETPIDDKPKPQKRYGGDFYPTETHAKRDE